MILKLGNMYIPFEIELLGGNTRFDYIVNFTILEHYADSEFIKRYRYNTKLIANSGVDVNITVAELCVVIQSIEDNLALKNMFIENATDVCNRIDLICGI
jgi:hypothetical protein